MNTTTNSPINYSNKDFESDQEIRWCPACGDFAILKQLQLTLPKLNIPKEKLVFISGIGCSSRFPYYMNTYGVHTIHGRAPSFATGLKLSRPDLNIWLVTGDGDALSIGGNHIIHLIRRDIDLQVLLFNNKIYGLTKGQFSPTSELGKQTKSSPFGTNDNPFNTAALILGAGSSFYARTMDKESKHMQKIFEICSKHQGTSIVEIYQNCNIFNDNAFIHLSDKKEQKLNAIFLEENEPLLFGENNEYGIRLDGYNPQIVNINDEISKNDLWIHHSSDLTKAKILAQFIDLENFPTPFGVFYKKQNKKIESNPIHSLGFPNSEFINKTLKGNQIWEI